MRPLICSILERGDGLAILIERNDGPVDDGVSSLLKLLALRDKRSKFGSSDTLMLGLINCLRQFFNFRL